LQNFQKKSFSKKDKQVQAVIFAKIIRKQNTPFPVPEYSFGLGFRTEALLNNNIPYFLLISCFCFSKRESGSPQDIFQSFVCTHST